MKDKTMWKLLQCNNSTEMHKSRILLLLFFSALLFRLVFVAFLPGFTAEPVNEPEPDAPQYEEIALNLLNEGSFYQTMNGEIFRAYRSPLWPLTIAMVYKVFGQSRIALRVFSVILASFVPVFLFLIALYLVEWKTAFLAAIMAVVYPFYLFYSGLYLTETLFITLLYAMILTVFRMMEKQDATSSILAGVVLALTCLARPVTYPMPLFVLLALIVKFGWNRRMLISFLLFCLSFTLLVSPWFIRNYQVLGAIIPGDTHGGHTIYGAYNTGLFKHPEMAGSWYIPTQDELPESYRYDYRLDDEVTRDRKFGALGRKFILEYPQALPWLVWRRALRFFSVWPSGALYRKLVSVFSWGLIFPLGLFGFWVVRKNWKNWLFPLLIITELLLVSLLIVASVRMRNPLDGLFMILAASTIMWLWGSRPNNQEIKDIELK
jgi:4-amino-4-deoxy-L-arabinose transferase-like glycosyltransferase